MTNCILVASDYLNSATSACSLTSQRQLAGVKVVTCLLRLQCEKDLRVDPAWHQGAMPGRRPIGALRLAIGGQSQSLDCLIHPCCY